MIDTIELYILILIDLDLVSTSQECEKKSSVPIISQSFRNDLDLIYCTVETRCDEAHTHFISSIQYSSQRTRHV